MEIILIHPMMKVTKPDGLDLIISHLLVLMLTMTMTMTIIIIISVRTLLMWRRRMLHIDVVVIRRLVILVNVGDVMWRRIHHHVLLLLLLLLLHHVHGHG